MVKYFLVYIRKNGCKIRKNEISRYLLLFASYRTEAAPLRHRYGIVTHCYLIRNCQNEAEHSMFSPIKQIRAWEKHIYHCVCAGGGGIEVFVIYYEILPSVMANTDLFTKRNVQSRKRLLTNNRKKLPL